MIEFVVGDGLVQKCSKHWVTCSIVVFEYYKRQRHLVFYLIQMISFGYVAEASDILGTLVIRQAKREKLHEALASFQTDFTILSCMMLSRPRSSAQHCCPHNSNAVSLNLVARNV